VNESARTTFASLTAGGKQVFLARVGVDLTIAGRACVLGRRGDDRTAALAALNELQHKLLSQIVALGMDGERYPDDVFWTILHETATRYSIDAALADAIAVAASR
jgi:hypothetical protein